MIFCFSETLSCILFQRDANCEYLLALANEQRIRIALPEYAFVEAEITAKQVLDNRITKIEDAQSILRQANRSQYHHWSNLINNLEAFKTQVVNVERPMILQQVREVLEMVTLIPFTSEALINAELRELGNVAPFKKNDRRIYESILSFAVENQSEKIKLVFLTKDQQDFDVPSIHDELAQVGVEIFFGSGECVRYIRDLLEL